MSEEKVELIVLAERGNERTTFHIPAERVDELKGWKLVGFCFQNKFNPSVAYVSCDDEFKKINYLPEVLNELNAFVCAWNIIDGSQRKTLVSLTNECGIRLKDALVRIATLRSYLTPVSKPATVEEQDEAIGVYYASALVNFKLGPIETCFSRSIGLGHYFDYEAYGRDIRLNGENGYWSDMYDRWVVNPIGNCE